VARLQFLKVRQHSQIHRGRWLHERSALSEFVELPGFVGCVSSQRSAVSEFLELPGFVEFVGFVDLLQTQDDLDGCVHFPQILIPEAAHPVHQSSPINDSYLLTEKH
jgi:hypothetical protein